MKRLLLLVVVLGALAALGSGPAGAATPCRDRIYNDWYPDGKIATTYPIACYRDALKHIRPDALTYSSLADDIRAAMQAALARQQHKVVPPEVGKGNPTSAKPGRRRHSTTDPTSPRSTDSHSSGPQPVSQTLPTTTLASGPTGSNGSGVPVPLLVLGALALLLVAAGAAGVLAKRARR